MNIYKCLNEITDYIETHLEEKIEYRELAKMMGVNIYTMQKIFSLIAGLPLSEYIRKRRLSNAGADLYNHHYKVMEIAIKYQYDSATAFSRAFVAFHGIKPSLVNKKTILKNYPKLHFRENIQTTNEFKYKIITLEKLELYGIGIPTNNQTIRKDAPNFFKKMNDRYHDKYGRIKYGMVTYQDSTREICTGYYILYDKVIKELEYIEIPKSKWLVFEISSQDSKDIQKMSQDFYLEFLPSCKYNLCELPELEYYHDNQTDFLIPIE